MHPPRACRRLAAILAVALVSASVAACGSSGSARSTASSRSRPGASAADPAVMRAALLREGDLPAGWRDAGEDTDDGSTDEAEMRIALGIPECAEFAEQGDLEDRRPKVESNEFEDAAEAEVNPEQASSAENYIVAYQSAAEATTAYEDYTSAQMEACLQQLFDQLFAQKSTEEAAAGEPRPTFTTEVLRLEVPTAGDAAAAFQGIITIELGELGRQVVFVIELVRVDQYVVTYTATLFRAPPARFGTNLVARSVDRLEAALHPDVA